HCKLAPQVESTTPKVRHEEPRANSADETHGTLANTEGVGVSWRKTSLEHEVCAPPNHWAARCLLNEPGADCKLGAAEVDAFETVPVGGTRGLLNLELVGVYHHCQGVFDVEVLVILRSQLQERCTSCINFAVTNQPPGFKNR